MSRREEYIEYLKIENERLRMGLICLENEFIAHGAIWNEPETDTLKEWFQIIKHAMKKEASVPKEKDETTG